MLRIKNPLQSTVTSSEFKELEVFQEMAFAILQNNLWMYLFTMCRALYDPMRTLCLADQKLAAMENIYFYVLQAEHMLHKYIAEATEAEYLISPRLRTVLEDTTHSVEPVMENDLIPEEEEEAHADIESDENNDSDYGGSEYEGSNYTGTGLVARGMRLWFHRKDNMCHEYALVGFILSPNPTIMDKAKKNGTGIKFHNAVKSLITKFFLGKTLVGTERELKKAQLNKKFWTEHGQFNSQTGVFDKNYYRVIAEDPKVSAHAWHFTYYRPITDILRRMGCIVTSKVLGNGDKAN